MNSESPLLLLPRELRLEIWEYLLSPTLATAQWHSNESAMTAISRWCILMETVGNAHDFKDRNCTCHGVRFHIHKSRESLGPQILRVNRQINHEALPCLYRNRLFEADESRIYFTLHDKVSDAWFILDRWLDTLSDRAKRYIGTIRIPMILSNYEVYGAHDALYSLSSRLLHLHKVHIQMCPSFVRERWIVPGGSLITFAHGPVTSTGQVNGEEDEGYWLGPIMAFADARIEITAVDRLDLSSESFGKIKTALEMDVWRQLLPLRTTRERRRIRRIQRALEAMEFADVDGLREDEIALASLE